MSGEEHAFTLSPCRHMSRHFRRMASGGHFSEWRNLSVPAHLFITKLKNDQSDGSAASLVKGFVFRSDFVSRHLRNPKVLAIIRQLRARIPQTAIGGKPQRSRNQEINANASDLRAFVVLCFRVGLYVPGAFAANTRIPAQAAGIESRGMLTPAACRPHGVHFLPEGERDAPPSPGAGIRPDALPSLSPSDALSRKRPLCPQIFTYSGFLLSGVQLHARTRSARLRESVSIWRALSAVLFPSGISGRPGAAVMVRLLIVQKGEAPQAPQPVGLTGERLPPKSSACAPQSAPFAMNCRGCTVTALKRLPASVSVCACSAGFRPAVPAVRRESPGAKPSAVRIA